MQRVLGRSSMLAIAGALAGAIAGLLIGVGVFGSDTVKTEFVAPGCKPGEAGCSSREPTHMHADWALYIDGQRQDFSAATFIAEKGNEERSADVHIHEPYTDVVHVHTTKTTWDEFLRTIGFVLVDPSSLPGMTADQTTLKLPNGTTLRAQNGKSFKFYVNNVRVDGVSNTLIGDLDRVLISYGSETDQQVEAQQLPQVKNDACILSERCLSRVDPNAPKETCQGGEGTTCVK